MKKLYLCVAALTAALSGQVFASSEPSQVTLINDIEDTVIISYQFCQEMQNVSIDCSKAKTESIVLQSRRTEGASTTIKIPGGEANAFVLVSAQSSGASMADWTLANPMHRQFGLKTFTTSNDAFVFNNYGTKRIHFSLASS